MIADAPQRPRILIVEDERIVARDLQMRLKRMGYAVNGVVGSGLEALQRVEDDPPDLVLMDVRLEGAMDGIEAAQRILQQHHRPVVFVTAHADPSTFDRAKQILPCGYLIKPYSDGELHRAVELALHKHHRPGEHGMVVSGTG